MRVAESRGDSEASRSSELFQAKVCVSCLEVVLGH